MSEPPYLVFSSSDTGERLRPPRVVRRETLQEVLDLADRKRALAQISPAQEEFVRELIKELET